jgi:hypothetical protein
MAINQQKLLPHLGESRTAILAIEQIEQSGHDRTSSFDHLPGYLPIGKQAK